MRYSRDFRDKVMAVKAAEQLSVRDVAERFGIHFNSVQRWSKRLEAKPCGPKQGFRTLDLAKLHDFYARNKDAYQAEAAAHFGVGRATIWRGIQRLRWSHKKNVGAPQSKYTKEA
jgi:transposase